MAERRMFAKSIIDSDMFLDMPSSTQNLYFHLAMRADDDGFVNAPQRIMRMVSCSKNDMDMLVFKNFVIPFESGICVIKHWRIHNYLRNDRYRPTIYTAEKNSLSLDDSKAYVVGVPDGIPLGIPNDIPTGDAGKDRLGEDSLDKTTLLSAFKVFESEGFGTITHYIVQEIEALIEDYTQEWLVDAMKESVLQGKRKLSYVRGILKSWKADGRDTNGKSTIGKTGQAARRQEVKEREVGLYIRPVSGENNY